MRHNLLKYTYHISIVILGTVFVRKHLQRHITQVTCISHRLSDASQRNDETIKERQHFEKWFYLDSTLRVAALSRHTLIGYKR